MAILKTLCSDPASPFLIAGVLSWLWGGKQRRLKRAAETFRQRREYLEARFLDMARSLGKPRGLRWLECQWQPKVLFARDRQSGLLTAFVGVHISFEAIEGSDMEEVAAVSSLRDATALFHYQHGQWGTGGRALFNMDPTLALKRLEDQYEPLAE